MINSYCMYGRIPRVYFMQWCILCLAILGVDPSSSQVVFKKRTSIKKNERRSRRTNVDQEKRTSIKENERRSRKTNVDQEKRTSTKENECRSRETNVDGEKIISNEKTERRSNVDRTVARLCWLSVQWARQSSFLRIENVVNYIKYVMLFSFVLVMHIYIYNPCPGVFLACTVLGKENCFKAVQKSKHARCIPKKETTQRYKHI